MGRYFDEYTDPKTEVFNNLRRNIQQISSVMLQKKMMEIQRQQQMQDAVRKAIITSVLSGKGKFKTPINMEQLISGEGQLPDLSEFEAISTPSTSVSITERPYSEILKASEVASRTPEEYYQAGMATPGERIKGTGFLGTGFGPGSKREFDLSPEAIQQQTRAKTILGSPYRTTTRQSYKGDVIDTTGTAVSDNLPDPSLYEEGTVYQLDDGTQYKIVNGEWEQI